MPPMNTPQSEPTAADKQAMLDLHAQGYSVREIGRRVGWNHATVGRHLNRMGADMDRSQTAEATAARVRKLNERRVALAEALFEDALSMRNRVWDEYVVVTNGPEGPDKVLLDEPPLKEQADGIKALHTTIDTIDRLLDGASNPEADAAKNVIMGIFDGLSKMFATDTDAGVDPDDRDHDYDIADDPNENKRDDDEGDDDGDTLWVDCGCDDPDTCDCEDFEGEDAN